MQEKRRTIREKTIAADCPACGCCYAVERVELVTVPSFNGRQFARQRELMRWCQDCGEEVSA
jgi:hypothetical protein